MRCARLPIGCGHAPSCAVRRRYGLIQHIVTSKKLQFITSGLMSGTYAFTKLFVCATLREDDVAAPGYEPSYFRCENFAPGMHPTFPFEICLFFVRSALNWGAFLLLWNFKDIVHSARRLKKARSAQQRLAHGAERRGLFPAPLSQLLVAVNLGVGATIGPRRRHQRVRDCTRHTRERAISARPPWQWPSPLAPPPRHPATPPPIAWECFVRPAVGPPTDPCPSPRLPSASASCTRLLTRPPRCGARATQLLGLCAAFAFLGGWSPGASFWDVVLVAIAVAAPTHTLLGHTQIDDRPAKTTLLLALVAALYLFYRLHLQSLAPLPIASIAVGNWTVVGTSLEADLATARHAFADPERLPTACAFLLACVATVAMAGLVRLQARQRRRDEEAARRLRQMMDSLNADYSGMISKAEMRTKYEAIFLSAATGPPPAAGASGAGAGRAGRAGRVGGATPQPSFDQFWAHIDRDGDGYVTLQELADVFGVSHLVAPQNEQEKPILPSDPRYIEHRLEQLHQREFGVTTHRPGGALLYFVIWDICAFFLAWMSQIPFIYREVRPSPGRLPLLRPRRPPYQLLHPRTTVCILAPPPASTHHRLHPRTTACIHAPPPASRRLYPSTTASTLASPPPSRAQPIASRAHARPVRVPPSARAARPPPPRPSPTHALLLARHASRGRSGLSTSRPSTSSSRIGVLGLPSTS